MKFGKSRSWKPVVRGVVPALVLGLGIGISGCAGCGGSSEAKVDARSTTLGQELEDLDAAYQKGIITEKEYKKKKKQMLDRY